MPGPALAGLTTQDILVHGWDLATATGHRPPADLDGHLAAHALGFAEQAITWQTRAPHIGPAVARRLRRPDWLLSSAGTREPGRGA